ncbi:MAG: M43 family zinc metalloprotease [Bacteroidia bacterium]|jgi:hypothetical protein
MRRFLIICLFISSFQFIQAQEIIPCATDELYREAIVRDPSLLKKEDDANALIRQQMNSLLMHKSATVRYVPVVFHIIHNNGFENISQAQIMDQLRILNEDYRKIAGTPGFSTNPLAADVEVEFRLAQYDPSGKKHDGINRIYNPGMYQDASDAVKSLSFWNSQKYLNIWVVSTINMIGGTGTILGYAQFPWMMGSSPNTDGIVIRADQVGKIGFGDISQMGRTLTHEIGHWLGLYHTFQGGCVGGTSATCASQGDLVCDTPPVSAASFGCQTGKNSCTNDVPDSIDLIRDYMDYSDGSCMNMFTLGQKARIQGSMVYRTGIFGTSPNFVQNLTYAGVNTDGTFTEVPAATLKVPFTYGFEEPSPTSSGWIINNFNNPGNGWQVNTTVAYSGTNSFYVRNFLNSTVKINSRDGFQTPEIDLNSIPNPTLEFYYAYAQKSTATNDSLTVRISNDFGMTEIPVVRMSGESMSTAGIQSAEFIPSGKQDWRKVSVDLSGYKTFTHARLRFELLNRRGNNIYVDEIAIRNGATGIEDDLRSEMQFSVSPNPAQTTATLHFSLKEKEELEFTYADLLGRELPIRSEIFESGQHQVEMNCAMLKPGIYFIRIQGRTGSFSHKLLIN